MTVGRDSSIHPCWKPINPITLGRDHSPVQCGKGFTQSSSLKLHQQIHTKERPFSCTSCGKWFRYLNNFTTHRRLHTRERPFNCSVCGKGFNWGASCRTREFTWRRDCSAALPVGRGSGSVPNSWCICRSTQGTDRSLALCVAMDSIIHLAFGHTKEKPFSCTSCGTQFCSASNLSVHKRVHTGERPFTCSACGKGFPQSSSLLTHRRVHTEERPFTCSMCEQSFTQLCSLLTHQCAHSGERSFASLE
ncbi:zinc finger protein 239-like [Rhincodon typus]|uniref:zinc finger protein 239-like n=1 Tax=Rhincodon typus TaxID=259920 RepID=UPI00202FD38C|nr:zinc finger protein 239-like [Rhincodon typus]